MGWTCPNSNYLSNQNNKKLISQLSPKHKHNIKASVSHFLHSCHNMEVDAQKKEASQQMAQVQKQVYFYLLVLESTNDVEKKQQRLAPLTYLCMRALEVPNVPESIVGGVKLLHEDIKENLFNHILIYKSKNKLMKSINNIYFGWIKC